MKQCFLSRKGPKAVGPYSTATVSGGFAFVSGMLPCDPATGKIVEGGIEAEARQAFENIRTVLEEMELGLADVLKTTVFLTDLENFSKVNAIYAEFFGPDYPARSCFEVSKLPMGAQIEIEVIASAIQ